LASGEVYIGGFFGLAKRRGLAYFQDWGLFVTDRRLIVLNKNVLPPHGWPVVTALRDQIELTLNATPARLDEFKKEAEIPKEEVEKLELSRPKAFRKGSMTVIQRSGRTTKFVFMDESDGIEAFERAKDLLGRFAADRLEVLGEA
jgi:hypothetical protein